MWKMKAHGLALAHRAFVGFLALWASLLGAFFQCGLFWPSPTWARAKPCGMGQIDTSKCAIYVQNRCPHAKLNKKTLQEVWSERKPSVSHLKVFGSIAYGHVPTQQRTKLEDQSKKYVFIGYRLLLDYRFQQCQKNYNRWYMNNLQFLFRYLKSLFG